MFIFCFTITKIQRPPMKRATTSFLSLYLYWKIPSPLCSNQGMKIRTIENANLVQVTAHSSDRIPLNHGKSTSAVGVVQYARWDSAYDIAVTDRWSSVVMIGKGKWAFVGHGIINGIISAKYCPRWIIKLKKKLGHSTLNNWIRSK